MMKAALPNYPARMLRVLDHIDRHLEDDLDLEAMSGVATMVHPAADLPQGA